MAEIPVGQEDVRGVGDKPPAVQIKDTQRLTEERLRVLQLVTDAEAGLTAVRDTIATDRELLLPSQGDDTTNVAAYTGATEAFVPRIATTVEQLVARIVQTIHGTDVLVNVQPESAEDRD